MVYCLSALVHRLIKLISSSHLFRFVSFFILYLHTNVCFCAFLCLAPCMPVRLSTCWHVCVCVRYLSHKQIENGNYLTDDGGGGDDGKCDNTLHNNNINSNSILPHDELLSLRSRTHIYSTTHLCIHGYRCAAGYTDLIPSSLGGGANLNLNWLSCVRENECGK